MRYYIVQDAAEVAIPQADASTGFNVYEVDASATLVIADDEFYVPRTLVNASDDPRFSVADVKELWTFDFHDADGIEPHGACSVTEVAAYHGVDVDELITKFSERLQDIYDNQTAGKHTFIGVLATFFMELEGK